MINKYYIIVIVTILSLIIILSYVSYKNSVNYNNLCDKLYFSFKQSYSISNDLIRIDVSKIHATGSLGGDIFNLNRDFTWGAAFPHNSMFIDPFLNGEFSVTIDQWTSSRDDFVPKKVTMKGAPLRYVFNKKNIIFLIYAGPDGDIDNESPVLNTDNITSEPHAAVLLLRYMNCPYIPKVNIAYNLIQYDPTNGLTSNGDVVWGIYRNPNWILGEYRMGMKSGRVP